MKSEILICSTSKHYKIQSKFYLLIVYYKIDKYDILKEISKFIITFYFFLFWMEIVGTDGIKEGLRFASMLKQNR